MQPDQSRRPPRATGLVAGLIAANNRLHEHLQAQHPERFHADDPDVLTVDKVAAMLRCSVDQARRIPRTELPAYQGPGKYLLYFRQDVMSYLRGRPRKNESAAFGAALRASPSRQRDADVGTNGQFDPSDVIARLPRRGS